MQDAFSPAHLWHILPLLIVAGWACLTLLILALGSNRSVRLAPVSILGLIVALGSCVPSWLHHASTEANLFNGMLVVDRYALFFDALFLLCALLTLLLSQTYLDEHDVAEGDYHPMVLFVTLGMMLLVHAADFLMLVIGLETMSLGVYSLVACWSGRRKSSEGGMKYFVMGAVASAFLVYGVALLYGATGSTHFGVIAEQARTKAVEPLFVGGMWLALSALAFKVALVPFHMWAPDAYEGAPTPISGFMATAVKAAGFAVLLRLLREALAEDVLAYGTAGWGQGLWTLSLLTMSVGNLVALRQNNVKRLLAYSSIAHAGYLALGVLALGTLHSRDVSPILFYLLQYAVTTIGAFGIVSRLGRRDAERLGLDEWAGLAQEHPLAAFAMTLCLLSLAGIPPTAGFLGKLYLFRAALENPALLSLVLAAAANSIVSVYYYLRPVVAMYFQDAPPVFGQAAPLSRGAGASSSAVAVAVCLVLVLGLAPGGVLWVASQSMLGP